ncbi:uncharacterized protein EI97DRAFT_438510 [Westerdykella ornata]|uniref:Uncharacterized protein n=1 Tax=Westerdykella ornata TaxID=318751 RepID=A0A6A6JWW8_WESOR|nr:uncharacterized protein EI97DRAFT_438510 [Westerdykella ornata]KAF2281111.1 hypothetical protein EI97DRAFT_438510 [Westerdykella ornata]
MTSAPNPRKSAAEAVDTYMKQLDRLKLLELTARKQRELLMERKLEVIGPLPPTTLAGHIFEALKHRFDEHVELEDKQLVELAEKLAFVVRRNRKATRVSPDGEDKWYLPVSAVKYTGNLLDPLESPLITALFLAKYDSEEKVYEHKFVLLYEDELVFDVAISDQDKSGLLCRERLFKALVESADMMALDHLPGIKEESE